MRLMDPIAQSAPGRLRSVRFGIRPCGGLVSVAVAFQYYPTDGGVQYPEQNGFQEFSTIDEAVTRIHQAFLARAAVSASRISFAAKCVALPLDFRIRTPSFITFAISSKWT
jgi:hypothetical protein